MKRIKKTLKGGGRKKISSLFLFVSCLLEFGSVSCSLTATRPTQEMSNTNAAIRAAKEVQADTLAPELYRQSTEWYLRAKHEYKFKNFQLAKEYADKARRLAEQAEFDSLRNGGNRGEVGASDPLANAPAPESTPYDYPTPTGTPAEEYDKRKAQEDAERLAQEEAARKASQPQAQPQNPPGINNIPTLGSQIGGKISQ